MNDSATTNQPDDYDVNNYQDDFDASDDAIDPIIDEETDDPTQILGVSPVEYKNEMDQLDIEDDAAGDKEGARERMEDLDDAAGQGGKS